MEQSRRFNLGATGDILLHLRLIKHAKLKSGGYDFSEQMANVKDLFEQSDLSIVNQESLIAGEKIGLSDYPKFNGPTEIRETLRDFGVDIVTIANNHTLDKGEAGVFESIQKWEEIDMPYVGAYKSKDDFDTLRVIHKNGLRVGFISITKRMAGVKVPKNKPWIIDYFEDAKITKICKRIRKIRELDVVDVLVVSCHFGKEYHFEPTSDQKEITKSLADAGADVILGHHPHVLQPIETLFDSRGLDTFVAYSLGNFFSGQKGLFRQVGGFLNVEIEKETSNSLVKFPSAKFTLTFVDALDGYKMYKFRDYVENHDIIKTHKGHFNSHEAYNRMKKLMQKYMPQIEVL